MFSTGPVWWRQQRLERAAGVARQIVVVTDVEGSPFELGEDSSLDETAGLGFLAAHGIPLVINSHRTRVEIERLHQTLGLLTPFISEHGNALCLPRGCFPFVPDRAQPILGREVIAFGKTHQEVVDALRIAAHEARVSIARFSELTIDEVSRELGVTQFEAQLVKHREYTELFRLVDDDEAALARIVNALRRRGLRCVPHGRHHLVSAAPDPAASLQTLRKLWRLTWGDHVMIGLGDSEDDVEWLQHVDVPIIVRNGGPSVPAHALARLPAVQVSRWPGQHGWSEAIFHSVGMLLTPRGDLQIAYAERKAIEQ